MYARKVELTDEKFQEIYTDEKFRNAVAYAHGVKENSGSWLKAMMYPTDYKVTQEQKDLADERNYQQRKNWTVACGLCR